MTTRIQVSDTGLEVIPPRDTLTQGSDNTMLCEFEFSGAWQECTEINAVFTDGINSATAPVTANACVIPVEILQNPWRFVYISLNGSNLGGTITSPFVRIGQVLPSAYGGEGGKFVTMAQLQEILLNYVLRAELGEYVTQETLDAALAAYIKASEAQEIFDALSARIDSNAEAIADKASQAELQALSDAVDGKADEGALADYWSKSEIGLQTSGDGKEFLANDGKYYPIQGGTSDEKTFIAEYNVTTAQEIIDFIDAANEPYAPMQVKRSGSYYTVVTAVKQDTDKVIIRTFGALSGNYYIFTYTITGNVWASASYGFQPTLISGNNIKTINGESLLGSGDIQIQGGTQVQADWNQTDDTSPAYIKNKPTIPDVSGLATQASVDAVSDTVSALETRVGQAETNITALQNDKADKTQLADYETSEHAAATYETKADASKIKSVTAAGFAVTPDAAGNVNIGGTDVSRVGTSGSWGSEITYTISQTLPAGASSDTKGSSLTIFKRTENSGATPRITMTIDGVQIATSADIPDVSRFATTDYVQNTFETSAHAAETYLKKADASEIKTIKSAKHTVTVENGVADIGGTTVSRDDSQTSTNSYSVVTVKQNLPATADATGDEGASFVISKSGTLQGVWQNISIDGVNVVTNYELNWRLEGLLSKTEAETTYLKIADASPIKSIKVDKFNVLTPDANGQVVTGRTPVAIAQSTAEGITNYWVGIYEDLPGGVAGPGEGSALSITYKANDTELTSFAIRSGATMSSGTAYELPTMKWVREYVASLDGTNISA